MPDYEALAKQGIYTVAGDGGDARVLPARLLTLSLSILEQPSIPSISALLREVEY